MKSYIEKLTETKEFAKVDYNQKYIENEQVQDEENGVIVSKIKPCIKNPLEMNSEYKMNDFKLENIIASGSNDLLKESRLLQNKMSDDDRNIDELTQKIENYVESTSKN